MASYSPDTQRARDLLSSLVSEPDTAIENLRERFDQMCANFELPADAEVENVTAGRTSAIWVSAPEADRDTVVIVLHRGGYVMGSAEGYRELGYRLSKAINGRALVVDYRLAPEVQISSARRRRCSRLPSCAGARPQGFPDRRLRRWWAGSGRADVASRCRRHPARRCRCRFCDARSRLYWRFAQGTGLYDDSIRLVEKLRQSGVDVRLKMAQDLPHVWPTFSFRVDAIGATDEIGAFVCQRISAGA